MIDECSPDQTGFARFSDDRKLRYRLARAITGDGIAGLLGLATIADRDPVRVVFVMLNPSTADAFKLDPTVSKCCGFAQRWGADVLEVVNLFALRSPYPSDLYPARGEKLDREYVGANASNDGAIISACAGAARVIAAWGGHGKLGGRDLEVSELLKRAGVRLFALGRNDDGTPIHPLARGKRIVKTTTEPVAWP